MTKPIEEMTPMEICAQKLANLTGRNIACVPFNRMPRTDWPINDMTQEDFKEMTDDFFSSIGPITMVHPNDRTS